MSFGSAHTHENGRITIMMCSFEGDPNILRLYGKGYTILPINPNYEQILGLKVYPSLLALENSPDVVLVFRRSEFVPEILDQAIEIGAKVIWLQEGIINLVAAERAREAGLTFVMDACMRKNHQRLMGSD